MPYLARTASPQSQAARAKLDYHRFALDRHLRMDARPRKLVCSQCGDCATRILGGKRLCSYCAPE